MADPDGELTVAQRLGRALDRGLLPAGGPAEVAERLIERLERPARLALLGLPGSGKSSILNLLVGAIVVPETLRLPTIIVQYGDVARMVCTLTDGTTRILPGHDLAEVLPLAPALVTLEMDLPALRVISLLEVSAGPMEAEQKRAATWASKRSDIVIWCTTSYLPKEQSVWESLPDSVKDNSFMFLTKVDLLGNRDAALAMHDRVELRAGEEFRQILSISAKQARAAVPPGGQVNRDLFRDSGASAVIAAIKTRVQSGRRADMDTAELLLARHVEASELVARRFAEEEESPEAWVPPPEPQPAPPAEPEPAAQPVETEGVFAARLDELVVDSAETAPEPDANAGQEDEAPEVSAPLIVGAPPAAVVPTASAESAPEGDDDQGTGKRRRFADRIRRVATDSDAGSAPAVPLKTTWKSKADTETTSEPEPMTASRPSESMRRPRATAASEGEAEPVQLADAEIVPETTAELPADTAPTTVTPSGPDVEAAPVDRRPRSVTPRPTPEGETPRTARPQLFGARRPAGAVRSPLPDLSSLRATPEEIAASAEANAQQDEDWAADPVVYETDDDAAAARGDSPSASAPAPADPSPLPGERPRLFDRPQRAGAPDATALPTEPARRASPLVRMAAPAPRAPIPVAPPEPVASRPQLDESQFSPRAIMSREHRSEPVAPAPRRERPRIAPRVAPAVTASAAAVQGLGADSPLVDEAIRLIVARSAELEQEIDPEGKVPVDTILDHTRETTEQVLALMGRGQSDALRKIGSDLGEVMDLIMLMQLEKGHAPADDALTLILQLKRELETLCAA